MKQKLLNLKSIILYAVIAGSLMSITPFSLAFLPNHHGHESAQILDAFVILLLNILMFFCSLWINLSISERAATQRVAFNVASYLSVTVLAIFIHMPVWKMLGRLPLGFYIRDEFVRNLIIFSISYVLTQAYANLYQNQLMKNKILEIQRESLAGQIESLKQQINPHFFFNSLNTLSGLAQENSQKTVEFIEKLSQVFRYVLDIQEKNLVTVTEEVQFAKAYIYLLKVRFDEKFTINFQVDENDEQRVPSLCTQLLLENCFKHNAMSTVQPMKIEICKQKGYLLVANSLSPLANTSGNGIGLTNLNERCRLLTGRELVIERTEDRFIAKVPIA